MTRNITNVRDYYDKNATFHFFEKLKTSEVVLVKRD